MAELSAEMMSSRGAALKTEVEAALAQKADQTALDAVAAVADAAVTPEELTSALAPKLDANAEAIAAAGGITLDANGTSRVVTWPAQFNARMAGLNLGTVRLYKNSDGQRFVTCSRTAEQVFGDFSNALSAPDVTYYVSDSGNDANDGLTPATAFRNESRATIVFNASAFNSACVFVQASSTARNRTTGFVSVSSNVSPTKPMAWLLYGGPLTVATTDTNFATTADATFTNTYFQAISNVTQAVDLLGPPDRFNRPPRIPLRSTPAIINSLSYGQKVSDGTDGGVSGRWYCRREDAAQPTTANTRAYRQVPNFLLSSNTSVYIGSLDGSQWTLEGGNTGCVRIAPSSVSTTKNIVVLKNVNIRYALRSISVEQFHGYVVTWNCTYGASDQDGANVHNRAVITVQTAGSGYSVGNDITLSNGWVLTVASVSSGGVVTWTEKTTGTAYSPGVATQVSTTGSGTGASFLFSYAAEVTYVDINATATDFGIPGNNPSNNAFTPHENAVAIAFGGLYAWGSGGTARGIDASAMVMVGSTIDTDRGDIWTGAASTQVKALFRVGAGSLGFLDDVCFRGDPNTFRIYNEGTVYEKNGPTNSPMPVFGTVTPGWP